MGFRDKTFTVRTLFTVTAYLKYSHPTIYTKTSKIPVKHVLEPIHKEAFEEC